MEKHEEHWKLKQIKQFFHVLPFHLGFDGIAKMAAVGFRTA